MHIAFERVRRKTSPAAQTNSMWYNTYVNVYIFLEFTIYLI